MRMLPLLVLVVACAEATAPRPLPTTDSFGGERPVKLIVPATYDNDEATALVIVLHGYSANGFVQVAYLGFDRIAEEQGVLVAAPDGTLDKSGNLFWNATDACCDFDGTGVDDVAYVSGLVRDISAQYNVDPKRIHLIGHSNGGFMSYRLACEKSELFASIVSIAGATWLDPAKCAPKQPVSVLQIHGTNDATIRYEAFVAGGTVKNAYPGVMVGMEHWRGYDRCAGGFESTGEAFDLDAAVAGDETTAMRAGACPAGIGLELWTMKDSLHIPGFNAAFRDRVWEWMDAHRKP